MYEQYKDLCRSGKFLVGDVFAYSYPEGVIYNLGTQRTWKEKAEMNYISTSLHKMMEMAEDYGIFQAQYLISGKFDAYMQNTN